MKSIRILIAITSIFCIKMTSAQQEPMYSQYMFNTLAVNPAYAGSREVFSATLLARAQWRGIEGAPSSQTLSMDAPLSNKQVGLGLIVFNDKLGLTQNTGVHGSYAYRIRLRKATLALGLKLGAVQYFGNLTQASLSTGTASTDAAFQRNVNTLIPSAGFGVYYTSDKYYLGASIPNLYSTELTRGDKVNINKYNHMFMMGGYVFSLGSDYKLKPSFLCKYVSGAPIQFDVNANFWFFDLIGLGASYRSGDAMVGMAEVQIRNNFRVGYAYDYTLTGLRKFNSGTHELILRFEFGFGKDKIITPRYF
jgi:type IX secretion system PorP/SprF family membrane protein